tara:strand:- start:6735 stop:7694 length:960 start_codon:yes stop_codon:yes gene_type:complete
MSERILVIGASGQIGTELVMSLRKIYGDYNVIASDIRPSNSLIMNSGPFRMLDIMNEKLLIEIVKKNKISQIYLLAAMLSAKAEQNIKQAWDLNMKSYSYVINLAKDGLIKKIFWPSSIAVFGPNSPKKNTPQHTIMDPNTVYGITKLVGERWNEYYFNKFGIDIRSLRYPGLISWQSPPGGGTTDYAVDIFYHAIKKEKYESYLSENTILPMMYMPDAIRSTIELMESPSEKIKIRSSYNISGISFSPKQLAEEIKKHIPNFNISYNTDFRQLIADSWPSTIADAEAKKDWGWQPKYDLTMLTSEMIKNIRNKYKIIS